MSVCLQMLLRAEEPLPAPTNPPLMDELTMEFDFEGDSERLLIGDIYDGADFAKEEGERVNLIIEPEIDEDMSNKEAEDVVFSNDSKDVIGGEQEELFSWFLAVIPRLEEPLQKLVLQDMCTINKSVFDVIINNENVEDFATSKMVKKFGLQIEMHSIFYVIDLIEKKFEVKYKDTSNEEQKKLRTSSFEEEESEVG
ncbi:hypothetical protein QJS10_CPB12g00140 [Acorus calamus]|uniref:Uncharacterized protein n=1 Tax=Acorus calamus TaxID=4465 RepID=A0AAV9DPM8_ACOCL|nr:hypothetical protein QJS10_CPB12g00140 [Acorus calamus]